MSFLLKNTFNLVNLEVSENFKKKNGVSNLKLLVYNSFLSTPILFATIFIKGEFTDLIKYFKEEHDFSIYNLIFLLIISSLVIMITNSSFFISNEKNTSLFTQLISDAKFIFITLISYCVLKFFIFTWKNITGLCLSTLAAIIITFKALFDNVQIKKPKKRKFYKLEDQTVQTDSINKMNVLEIKNGKLFNQK